MTKQDLIISILEDCCPDECDIAGPSNLRAIVAGPVDLARTEGGANLDLTQVLMAIVALAAFIDNSISIIDAYVKAGNKRAGSSDAKAEVESKAPVPPELSHVDREREVYDRILKWLREQD